MKTKLLALCLLCATPASASTIIFQDDFNRPNSADVLNNWNEFNADATSINNGKLMIVGGDDPLGPLVGHGLVTEGVQGIKLSFDLFNVVAGPGENLIVDLVVSPQVEPLSIALFSLTDPHFEIIRPTIDSQSRAFLLFRFLSDDPTHTVSIDNLLVTTVVPIPAALPLFAGGLGVMAWMARRKKRMAVAEA